MNRNYSTLGTSLSDLLLHVPPIFFMSVVLVIALLTGCELLPNSGSGDLPEENIEGVEIKDDSANVVSALGSPAQVVKGSYPGAILIFEGQHDYLEVELAPDSTGDASHVMSVCVYLPYAKRVVGVRLGNSRATVRSKLGTPDRISEPSGRRYDVYQYSNSRFRFKYVNDENSVARLYSICMGPSSYQKYVFQAKAVVENVFTDSDSAFSASLEYGGKLGLEGFPSLPPNNLPDRLEEEDLIVTLSGWKQTSAGRMGDPTMLNTIRKSRRIQKLIYSRSGTIRRTEDKPDPWAIYHAENQALVPLDLLDRFKRDGLDVVFGGVVYAPDPKARRWAPLIRLTKINVRR